MEDNAVKQIFVKPTTDPGPRLPHNPQMRIPQEGMFVTPNTTFRRWLNTGDLVEAEPPKAKTKAAAKATTQQGGK